MNVLNKYRYIKRVIRWIFGNDLLVSVSAKRKKLWLGEEGGQWCVCPDEIDCDSVIYSFGVGEDVSFDLALIRKFDVTVHGFDPTPYSIEWVRLASLPSQFIFHEVGLASFDGIAKFMPPDVAGHVSHRLVELENGNGDVITGEVNRLITIMGNLGHQKIDLVKMDIEGAEYEVIESMIQAKIFPKQLLVEFHHRFPNIGLDRTRKAIHILGDIGYKVLAVSANGEEYSFIFDP